MTSYCCANGPEVHVKEVVMIILIRKHIVRCVLLIVGRCLEIQRILGLHAEAALAIRVNIFITLRRHFDVGKINIFLIKWTTTAEAVPRVPGP